MAGERDTYQPPLDLDPSSEGNKSPEKEDIYFFAKGTTIFPESNRRGDLRSPIHAKKLPTKIKGLTGFESIERIDLQYLSLRELYWSMPPGTRFGAWSKTAHKVKK